MSAPALAPRMLRAAVFTAVCVVLSALGHALASCAGIALWSVAAGFLGVFGVTVLFTGRERSLPAIVGALTVGQLGLHALFGFGQRRLAMGAETDQALVRLAAKLVCGQGGTSLSPADAARIVSDAGLTPPAATGHGHMAGMTGMTGGATAGAAELMPSLPMLLGHLLAALATGWLLRRGDLALGRLVRLSTQGATELAACALVRSLRAALFLVRALLAGLPGAPATGPRGPARTAFASSPPPVAEALQHTVIRRGPPAASCVLAA
ncbi:hypothetical protein [Streptomyces sp. NBC_01268]|uniref:hypothetical protein n=1 Tax=Streptomyces sp. NBC_01268 TaxID=2903806 RepID=UPI002E32A4CF|nr:hypothetical protein [Streptomyces sp. NBC_01268]